MQLGRVVTWCHIRLSQEDLSVQSTESRSKTTISEDSQTGRTLLNLRGMLLRGDFQPGERISELPLVARLLTEQTGNAVTLTR